MRLGGLGSSEKEGSNENKTVAEETQCILLNHTRTFVMMVLRDRMRSNKDGHHLAHGWMPYQSVKESDVGRIDFIIVAEAETAARRNQETRMREYGGPVEGCG